MRKVKWLLATVMTLSVAPRLWGFETNFGEISYSGNVPTGWALQSTGTAYATLSATQPQTPGDSTESGLDVNFYNATKENLFYREAPIEESLDCDTLLAKMRVYVTPQDGKVDAFQVVVSTNDAAWSSYVCVGEPIEVEEAGRDTPGWKVFTRKLTLPGLSAAKPDLYVGIRLIPAGKSHDTAYIHSLELHNVASAAPMQVCLKRAGVILDELMPGDDAANISAIVVPDPADSRLQLEGVYGVIDRNGVIVTNRLLRVEGSDEYTGPAVTAALDAGETLRISAFSRYQVTESLPVAGIVNAEDGYVYEDADAAVSYVVAKAGSVWINECSANRLEVCGTTNRVMSSGWSLVVYGDGDNEVCRAELGAAFDFTANMLNGVIGFDTRELCWQGGELPSDDGMYRVALVNSCGIPEHVVEMTFADGAVWGMSGYARWHADAGYAYDWSGTATDGTFVWGKVEAQSFCEANPGQGFSVPVSASLVVNTTDASGANISLATVVVQTADLDDETLSGAMKRFEAVSADGFAALTIEGESPSPGEMKAVLSGSAFGWTCAEMEIVFANAEVRTNALPFRATIAADGFDDLGYWENADKLQWESSSVSRDGKTEKVLRLNTYAVTSGAGLLKSRNYLSANGHKMCSVDFDFCNTVNSYAPYDLFTVMISTNNTLAGEIVSTPALCNKRAEYANGEWYRYQAVFELPDGFAEASELWVGLKCETQFKTHTYTYVDNLRIAFQDVVTATGLTRSVEKPATGESVAFDLDVLPQTTGTVAGVSADLHLTLNGVEQVIPFAFPNSERVTNDLSRVEGEAKPVTLSISGEALADALGGPFLSGDEVSYYAAVHYDAANGATDPAERYETRFFPDNSTTSEIDGTTYWVVEGDYGVAADLSANTFTVSGAPLSCIGEPVVTTDGVSFDLHGYAAAGITNLTVSLNGKDYAPFEGLETNAQVRVTGSFALPESDKLDANTEYVVTIAATDANGEAIEPSVFTIVTLPTVTGATITGLSADTVRLTVSGNAAGFVAPAEWTQTGARAWERSGIAPNTRVEATVFATNQVGAASVGSVTAAGYTLAAVATKAPVIEKGVTTVTVGADYTASADGNPEATEYAVRVTTSAGGEATSEWKTLTQWRDAPETFAAPMIDLTATNFFSFVTRNADGAVTANPTPVTTNCWFEMTAQFEPESVVQVAEPYGTVRLGLAFSDPAQGADATATVEYKLGEEGAWTPLCADFDVGFDEQLSMTTNLAWDAWTAVGGIAGTYAYTLRTRVVSGARASEWVEVADTLDFAAPTGLAIAGTPASGAVTADSAVSLAATATDATAVTYHWTFNGVESMGATLTGTAKEGANEVRVYAVDALGNRGEPVVYAWTLDTTAPTGLAISGTPAPGALTATPAVELTAAATDATAVTYHWTFNGVESTGATLTGTAREGANEASVCAVDAAGNTSAAVTRTWTLDTTAPTGLTISGTPAPGAVTAEAAFSLAATATDATAVTYHWTFNGVESTGATLTGTAREGANTASVCAVDAAGNTSAAVTRTWTLDTTAPTRPVIGGEPAADGTTNAKEFRFFAESTDATAVTYHWTFDGVESTGATLAGTAREGANTVSVYAVDAAGNTSETATRSWTVDTVAPTVVLASASPAYLKEGETLTVTATFSEAVTGFTAAAVTVVNGTAQVSGSGAVYAIAVSPTADGAVSVRIAADAVTDLAGNGNAASAMLTRTYDTTAPEVTLTRVTAERFNTAPMTVLVELSERVTNDFTLAALVVENGTIAAIEAVADTPNAYQVAVTPVEEGEVSVQVAANTLFDVVGHGNAASAKLACIYDVTKPTVKIASETPDPFKAGSVFTLVATFSEAVTNFTAEAVTVVNGTAKVAGSGAAYTIAVTPEEDGEVSVRIAADAVADAAGNGNEPSEAVVRVYDATRPSVTLASETRDPFNGTDVFTVVAAFSEAVTNFTAAAVTAGNGTVGEIVPLTGEGYTNAYSFVVTPEHDGEVTVAIAADAVTDLAGNGNAASETLVRTCDVTPPTVTFASSTSAYFNADNTTLTVTATFSEPIAEEVSADAFDVRNGKIDVFSGSGKVYALTLVPDGEGEIAVRLKAGVVTDAADNANVESGEFVRVNDTTSPTDLAVSGVPQGETSERRCRLVASATDESPVRYQWMVLFNGVRVAMTTTAEGVAFEREFDGAGTVRIVVQPIDAANNYGEQKSFTWTIAEGGESEFSDVAFGDDVSLPVDSETGATNRVTFTSVAFRPGAESTFTLQGFTAKQTEIANLNMWLVVRETLAGPSWRVALEATATYDAAAGTLTVTLPATALQRADGTPFGSLFITGIDNQNQE